MVPHMVQSLCDVYRHSPHKCNRAFSSVSLYTYGRSPLSYIADYHSVYHSLYHTYLHMDTDDGIQSKSILQAVLYTIHSKIDMHIPIIPFSSYSVYKGSASPIIRWFQTQLQDVHESIVHKQICQPICMYQMLKCINTRLLIFHNNKRKVTKSFQEY